MSSFASQLSVGFDQAMTQLGVMATYTRASDQSVLSLMAQTGVPDYRLADGGVALASESNPIVVSALELTFEEGMYEPCAGDTIQYVSNGYTFTCVVSNDSDSKFCWTWADRYMLRRRIFTKITGTEPEV